MFTFGYANDYYCHLREFRGLLNMKDTYFPRCSYLTKGGILSAVGLDPSAGSRDAGGLLGPGGRHRRGEGGRDFGTEPGKWRPAGPASRRP